VGLFDLLPSSASELYRNVRELDNPRARAARAECEILWREYEPLAVEPNFIAEFAKQTHERWFEMYLTVALKRTGLPVVPGRRGRGPDVLLDFGDHRTWIEAIAPGSGDPMKPDSVPPPPVGEAFWVPFPLMALRVASALDTKAKQIKSYVTDGIVSETDVVVIAVNVHGIYNAWSDVDRLMRMALYGVEGVTVTFDLRDNSVHEIHPSMRDTIPKASGNVVRMQPFLDGSLPHISAALGSSVDLANHPDPLGRDFVVFPNVTSRIAWPDPLHLKVGHALVLEEFDGGWNTRMLSCDVRGDPSA